MTSVRDIIIIAVILLAIGIVIATVVYISHTINAALVSNPIIANNTLAVSVISSADVTINYMDYLYLVGFLAFFIALVVTSWFAASHPIFSVIYFVVVIFFTFFSVILQYVWSVVASDPFYVSALVSLPITNYILSHLAYFMAVFGLVGILLMFAKSSSESGFNG